MSNLRTRSKRIESAMNKSDDSQLCSTVRESTEKILGRQDKIIQLLETLTDVGTTSVSENSIPLSSNAKNGISTTKNEIFIPSVHIDEMSVKSSPVETSKKTKDLSSTISEIEKLRNRKDSTNG